MIHRNPTDASVTQNAERAISDLACGVQSVRRLSSATPSEIMRLDGLLSDLANIISQLEDCAT